MSTEHVISVVGEADLEDLLPLLRGYCDFYEVAPLNAARLGVMNDLFVADEARGTGLADRLIAACRERAAIRGARELAWQTAKDNHRAQKVYDRIGGTKSEWLDYSLPVA
jgi:GNAT superfamily N-acetyltransferase